MIKFIIPDTISKKYHDELTAAGNVVNALIQTEDFRLKLMNSNMDILQGSPSNEIVAKVKTNADVYRVISSANIELKVNFYSRWWTSAVAYQKNGTLYLNTRKIGGWGIFDYASTFLHEATHLMGFSHDFRATSRRPRSVPYTMNTIVEELAI